MQKLSFFSFYCFMIPLIINSSFNNSITDPVYALISRTTPTLSSQIELIYNPSFQDSFTLTQAPSKIQISGNSQISLAVGYNYYLTRYLNSSISWTGDNLNNLPKIIPQDLQEKTKNRTFKYTYYLNVCTFSYSMVWWDWPQWEKELDFMAMRGINMALAFTGQEYVYLETMKQLGINENEVLEEFFSGPAFMAWQRMGNIRRWGGPLRIDWINEQYKLQLLILKRMKELGMKSILPAFSGFVPKSLKEKFPEANINPAERWNGFPDNYTMVYMVEPTDPLFQTIAKRFTDNLQKFFGPSDHLYNGDQFNEVDPSTNKTEYLKSAGKAMIEGLKESDPDAVWVLQGWLFAYSPFWKDVSLIEAYLSGVEKEDLIVLDLYSEVKPIYDKTSSYFNKPYIWNELHDFGGNMGLYGKVSTVMTQPFAALNSPNSSIIGVGITMEGIFQNMIVYDLLLDVAWMEKPRDIMEWTEEYIRSRYGLLDEDSKEAWRLLVNSVYNCDDGRRDVTTSYIEKRPTFAFENNIYYNMCSVVEAGKKLVKTARNLNEKCTDGLLFDVVDVLRQALSDLFTSLFHKKLIVSVENKDLNLFMETRIKMIDIIDDLDALLGTRKEFLLGKWLEDAEKWGKNNENDIKHYRLNAKNQLTMWGPASNINDYASKQWNGLMKSYYLIRWKRFFEEIYQALVEDKEFNQKEYDDVIGKFEIEWNYELEDKYLTKPLGNSIEISELIYEKYDKDLKTFCMGK